MSKRILIAEDELSSREMLATFGKMHGYEVTSVADGRDLLLSVADEQFDLIITDLMMMGLDGATATDIFKMHDTTTPVIALTSLSPQETERLKNKFIRIFHKPCNFTELYNYVESLIGK